MKNSITKNYLFSTYNIHITFLTLQTSNHSKLTRLTQDSRNDQELGLKKPIYLQVFNSKTTKPQTLNHLKVNWEESNFWTTQLKKNMKIKEIIEQK